MKKVWLIGFLFLVHSFSHAISEDGYQEKWKNEVFPFFLEHTTFHFMMSHDDNLKLHYGILLNQSSNSNKNLIVVSPGRSEPFYKYAELAYDLYQKGFSLAFLDHRGQGGSERILANPEKSHVKRFKYYVNDLEKFMDKVVSQIPRQKTFLLAHSMGSTIGMMLMAKRSDLFDKAVLSSPMLEPNTGKYSPVVALAYASALRAIGKGSDWAPGEGGYNTPVFEGNEVTGSRVRREMAIDLYEDYDDFKIGGMTVDWIGTSLASNNHFVLKYKKVRNPVIVLKAGDDTVVFTKRQHKFCLKAKKCQMIEYTKAKHEILMETDNIRNDVLKRINSFFQ